MRDMTIRALTIITTTSMSMLISMSTRYMMNMATTMIIPMSTTAVALGDGLQRYFTCMATAINRRR